MKTLPLDLTVSGDTPAQILLSLFDILKIYEPKIAAKYAARPWIKKLEEESFATKTNIRILTAQIIRRLNRLCPPYTYFGHHPVNDVLGVWIDLEKLHAAEKTGRLSQVTAGQWKGVKSTHVLEIQEDGAVALFKRKTKEQLWRMR